jgi:hypothetical protein
VIGPSNPTEAVQLLLALPLPLEALDAELLELLLEELLPHPATNAPIASVAMIMRGFTAYDLLLGDPLLS